jgi:DNA polymerase III epsilon subunit family exonuclease
MDSSAVAILTVFVGIILFALVLGRFLPRDTPESVDRISIVEHATEPQSTARPNTLASLSEFLPCEFVVLDLETTGLNSERDEIIEFGAIRVTLGADRQPTFQCLVRPARKVPAKITRITGITQTMVESEGLGPEIALRQFLEFIGDLPLVTFNAEFDMGFLQSAARKQGVTITNSYACALKRARRAWPGLQSYKLVDLAVLGNLSVDDAHRALGDCNRALIVFVSATQKLGQKVRWTKLPAISHTRP